MTTPAIHPVLSAIEGIEVVAPALQAFVVPLALLVLFGLFAIQSSGTEMIGRFSGPIMALYFVAIAALGLTQIVLSKTTTDFPTAFSLGS